MCNKYCKKKNKWQFSTCHIVYMMGVIWCVFEIIMLHMYTCVEMWEEQYTDKIFRIYGDRYTFHYLGLLKKIQTIFGIYVDRDTFHYPGVWEKYLEFMWIEIHSIIWEISIPCKPMFSLCDKKYYLGNIGTNHGFFYKNFHPLWTMFSLCDNYKRTWRQCSHRSWIFLTPSYDNRTKSKFIGGFFILTLNCYYNIKH